MRFTTFKVISPRGKTCDFDVAPQLRRGFLTVPSARIRLSDIKNVEISKVGGIHVVVDLVNPPPEDPEVMAKRVNDFTSGFNEADYL